MSSVYDSYKHERSVQETGITDDFECSFEGFIHPKGEDSDHDGFNMRADEFDEFSRLYTGQPCRIEHLGEITNIGTVRQVFKDEETQKLKIKATLDMKNPKAKYIARGIESGELAGLSIGSDALERIEPDGRRTVVGFKPFEVSVCKKGALPGTKIKKITLKRGTIVRSKMFNSATKTNEIVYNDKEKNTINIIKNSENNNHTTTNTIEKKMEDIKNKPATTTTTTEAAVVPPVTEAPPATTTTTTTAPVVPPVPTQQESTPKRGIDQVENTAQMTELEQMRAKMAKMAEENARYKQVEKDLGGDFNKAKETLEYNKAQAEKAKAEKIAKEQEARKQTLSVLQEFLPKALGEAITKDDTLRQAIEKDNHVFEEGMSDLVGASTEKGQWLLRGIAATAKQNQENINIMEAERVAHNAAIAEANRQRDEALAIAKATTTQQEQQLHQSSQQALTTTEERFPQSGDLYADRVAPPSVYDQFKTASLAASNDYVGRQAPIQQQQQQQQQPPVQQQVQRAPIDPRLPTGNYVQSTVVASGASSSAPVNDQYNSNATPALYGGGNRDNHVSSYGNDAYFSPPEHPVFHDPNYLGGNNPLWNLGAAQPGLLAQIRRDPNSVAFGGIVPLNNRIREKLSRISRVKQAEYIRGYEADGVPTFMPVAQRPDVQQR